MKRIPAPDLDKTIIQAIADRYSIYQHRGPGEFHLSTAVYCLTRGFFEATNPIQPTAEEVMLFAIGLGLQDILTPSDAFVPKFELEGIIYRPDFALTDKSDNEFYYELKTSRMAATTLKNKLPDTWVEYIMGGCYIRNVKTYNLSTLLIMGDYHPPFPQLYSETLMFSKEEITINWEYIKSRKAIYDKAFKLHKPPSPYIYCKEWECKYCRYKVVCEVLANQEEKKNKEVML